MSLLVSVAAIQRARIALPVELLACSFHSSQVHLFKRVPSRLRLAEGLKSTGRTSKPVGLKEKGPRAGASSRLGQVRSRKGKAQRKPGPPPAPFIRDTVPHSEAKDLFMKDRHVVKRQSDDASSHTQTSQNDVSSRLTIWKEKARKPKRKVDNTLVEDEFDRSVSSDPIKSMPSEFTSPPLMPGLLDSVVEVLGPHATPTAIQRLSIKHLLYPWKTKEDAQGMRWRESLLASETGSGKSLAYMLPMLQDLKTSELSSDNSDSKRMYNPRAIVLAPTHELSRQLAATAKSLSHNIRLRIVCLSRANIPSTVSRNLTASKMSSVFADASVDGEFEIRKGRSRGIDLLIGTPSKVLEGVRGHGWNWQAAQRNAEDPLDVDEEGRKISRKKFVVGQPQVGLHRVEWVIVDEADILFDSDFQETTRLLLADIAAARGKTVEEEKFPNATSSPEPLIHDYPFNLVLTSATIPKSLATYLEKHHPRMKRLVSPNVHHLPSTLMTEHVAWSGGNHNADIESRIKRIWYADMHQNKGTRSKILVFCNKNTRVEELGRYLSENGVPSMALTSAIEARRRGSNRHLDGFLRKPGKQQAPEEGVKDRQSQKAPAEEAEAENKDAPNVLITTSLLSRGLDFLPEIKNVLIVDAPRNMIDFIHRAGRTARAGARGTVIVFGKAKGRGAGRDKDVVSKVKSLL